MRRNSSKVNLFLIILAIALIAILPSVFNTIELAGSGTKLESPLTPGVGWGDLRFGQSSLEEVYSRTSWRVTGDYSGSGTTEDRWNARVTDKGNGVIYTFLDQGDSDISGDYFHDTIEGYKGTLYAVGVRPAGDSTPFVTSDGLSLNGTRSRMFEIYGEPGARWVLKDATWGFTELNYYTQGLLVGTVPPSSLASSAGDKKVSFLAICPPFEILYATPVQGAPRTILQTMVNSTF